VRDRDRDPIHDQDKIQNQRLSAQTPTIQTSMPGKKRSGKASMPPERHLVFKAGSDMFKMPKQENDDRSKQDEHKEPDECG
jgi:hypothetical protein